MVCNIISLPSYKLSVIDRRGDEVIVWPPLLFLAVIRGGLESRLMGTVVLVPRLTVCGMNNCASHFMCVQQKALCGRGGSSLRAQLWRGAKSIHFDLAIIFPIRLTWHPSRRGEPWADRVKLKINRKPALGRLDYWVAEVVASYSTEVNIITWNFVWWHGASRGACTWGGFSSINSINYPLHLYHAIFSIFSDQRTTNRESIPRSLPLSLGVPVLNHRLKF